MKYIELLDSTGRTWVSDVDTDGAMTPEVIKEFTDHLKKLGEINDFRLLVGGVSHYFHPAHIVMWVIKDTDGAA